MWSAFRGGFILTLKQYAVIRLWKYPLPAAKAVTKVEIFYPFRENKRSYYGKRYREIFML